MSFPRDRVRCRGICGLPASAHDAAPFRVGFRRGWDGDSTTEAQRRRRTQRGSIANEAWHRFLTARSAIFLGLLLPVSLLPLFLFFLCVSVVRFHGVSWRRRSGDVSYLVEPKRRQVQETFTNHRPRQGSAHPPDRNLKAGSLTFSEVSRGTREPYLSNSMCSSWTPRSRTFGA